MHARPFVAMAAFVAGLAACTHQEGSNGEPPAVDAARRQVLAPIETAELLVRESSPPQYAVRVTSGLPSGCARFDRIDIEREAMAFELTVWNTLPANDDVACTMIYGTTVDTAELGSDFEPGRSYDVRINGETTLSFVAQ